jgi:hypothetical protein
VIVESERPSDTEAETHTDSVSVVDGVPTRVWTPTPKPPPPPPSPEERIAAAATALAGLDTLPEVPDPLLPADVAARTDALAEILTDVRTALEA